MMRRGGDMSLQIAFKILLRISESESDVKGSVFGELKKNTLLFKKQLAESIEKSMLMG